MGSEPHPVRRSRRTKVCCSPPPFQGAAVIWLKGEKEGEIKGRRTRKMGLQRKDGRSKTRKVRRKRKPPLLPQIDSRQCPPSRLCSELRSRMPPPWDARPEQKGSGGHGASTQAGAARVHWAFLALWGEVSLLPGCPYHHSGFEEVPSKIQFQSWLWQMPSFCSTLGNPEASLCFSA